LFYFELLTPDVGLFNDTPNAQAPRPNLFLSAPNDQESNGHEALDVSTNNQVSKPTPLFDVPSDLESRQPLDREAGHKPPPLAQEA